MKQYRSGMKGQKREIRNKGPQPDSNQGDSWTLKPLGRRTKHGFDVVMKVL